MESDTQAMLRQIMEGISDLRERVSSLEGRGISTPPPKETLGIDSTYFTRRPFNERRETMLAQRSVQHTQVIPKFDQKFHLNSPVKLLNVWIFVSESQRYVGYYPDADFYPQTFISSKAKNEIVGKNSTLTSEEFERLTEQELFKQLLSAVKPVSSSEFLSGFVDLIKYETSWSYDRSRRYYTVTDWREQYELTKLVSDKAKIIYAKLCEMVHGNNMLIPPSKPDPKFPKQSLIEAFESLLFSAHIQILKKNNTRAFHEKQWSFTEYVTLIEHVNQSVFTCIEPSLPFLEYSNILNRTTKHEEDSHLKTLRQMSRATPRVQAISEGLEQSDDIADSRPRHMFAGGSPEDIDNDFVEMLTEELEDKATPVHESDEVDQEVIAALDTAVRGVRWASDKNKPLPGSVKVADDQKQICWYFMHSKGEACPKGVNCPNSHNPKRIREELDKVAAFWASK
jgi:hypothetical protein